MKGTNKQYLFYIIFAIISTIINISTQVGVQFVLDKIDLIVFKQTIFSNITIGLFIKLSIATIVAFLFKFIVDKFLIFEDREKNVLKGLGQIFIYGLFAVFTTLIFWGTVFIFRIIFDTFVAEIIGSVIGLAIGYTAKFFLDRKFVFNR